LIALYLGAPGSGKSTLMRKHVHYNRVPGLHFLIVDHDGSWAGLNGKTFTSVDEFRAHPTLARFSYFQGVPGNAVAELAIEIGDTVYVDDECDAALLEKWRGSPLREILKRGRHLTNGRGEVCSVSALLATHRPANLPADIPALCTRIYLGRLQAHADADRVYREGWIPGVRGVMEAARILQSKKPGEFTVWPPAL
jgi:hypothetical protein